MLTVEHRWRAPAKVYGINCSAPIPTAYFLDKGFHILWYQPIHTIVGIKAAIVAFRYTERDMNIEAEVLHTLIRPRQVLAWAECA